MEGSDVNPITVANVQSVEDKIVHQHISFDDKPISKTVPTNNSFKTIVLFSLKSRLKKTMTVTIDQGKEKRFVGKEVDGNK